MEAFIIAQRVLTAEHMSKSDHNEYKYLKRYDMPNKIIHKRFVKMHSHNPKTMINISSSLQTRKTKNLLSNLTKTMSNFQSDEKENSCKKQQALNKYFKVQNDGLRENSPGLKNKKIALIKKMEPLRQQYDANYDFVTHRFPSWTFTPHNRQIGQSSKKCLHAHLSYLGKYGERYSVEDLKEKGSGNEQLIVQKVQRKIYQQPLQRPKARHFESDNNLKYSPKELNRCTTEIFKKYQLDKDPNFKKFLCEIQQL